MNINYKIFNPLNGLYENNTNNEISLLDISKYAAINFYINYSNPPLISKVYITEDNKEIIKPYENSFYT